MNEDRRVSASRQHTSIVRKHLTRDGIELRLRMPLLNVCLAASAGNENDLRDAKAFLLACVETMISEATRGQM